MSEKDDAPPPWAIRWVHQYYPPQQQAASPPLHEHEHAFSPAPDGNVHFGVDEIQPNGRVQEDQFFNPQPGNEYSGGLDQQHVAVGNAQNETQLQDKAQFPAQQPEQQQPAYPLQYYPVNQPGHGFPPQQETGFQEHGNIPEHHAHAQVHAHPHAQYATRPQAQSYNPLQGPGTHHAPGALPNTTVEQPPVQGYNYAQYNYAQYHPGYNGYGYGFGPNAAGYYPHNPYQAPGHEHGAVAGQNAPEYQQQHIQCAQPYEHNPMGYAGQQYYYPNPNQAAVAWHPQPPANTTDQADEAQSADDATESWDEMLALDFQNPVSSTGLPIQQRIQPLGATMEEDDLQESQTVRAASRFFVDLNETTYQQNVSERIEEWQTMSDDPAFADIDPDAPVTRFDTLLIQQEISNFLNTASQGDDHDVDDNCMAQTPADRESGPSPRPRMATTAPPELAQNQRIPSITVSSPPATNSGDQSANTAGYGLYPTNQQNGPGHHGHWYGHGHGQSYEPAQNQDWQYPQQRFYPQAQAEHATSPHSSVASQQFYGSPPTGPRHNPQHGLRRESSKRNNNQLLSVNVKPPAKYKPRYSTKVKSKTNTNKPRRAANDSVSSYHTTTTGPSRTAINRYRPINQNQNPHQYPNRRLDTIHEVPDNNNNANSRKRTFSSTLDYDDPAPTPKIKVEQGTQSGDFAASGPGSGAGGAGYGSGYGDGNATQVKQDVPPRRRRAWHYQ
ncbi:uncharacterized protein HMPREF1120_01039 [Exophiala dermatitidis NIH/UT8656]|uniref:Uncharacterized protein n=1 Tax=Exophiala dermatitidis (strain ATCC 34100 / CBS 525.76 / NIH/UT8656) TaxID=858893 RepID=H6BLD9_EXODN|nr:uncharacterized protein HMPREF1120_01039 [Exophiala dermatitidis NIH/UT8656]EHY52832.1 hypothetical protein HMPREF1120_01039 [Exophiala dermatitidis NIH/UT8656]